ncbi:MAG: acetyl-CoA carboxylase biotin carboxyl carrier protein [Candidatus Paceibacteria bacterium]|jgi:acetyl-CoA carboxylase biotin carboxyl carrier protein
MHPTTELLLRKNGDSSELCAPEVGLFTCALGPGALIGPGQVAGTILCLGRQTNLIVPPGVHGRISSPKRDLIQAPVGYGDTLYELSSIDAAADELEAESSTTDGAALVLHAAQAGRFYHRPSPDEPAYIEVGEALKDGQAIGLVEVMKTFSQVHYKLEAGLPSNARFVRFLVDDGAEIRRGDGLIEVESS